MGLVEKQHHIKSKKPLRKGWMKLSTNELKALKVERERTGVDVVALYRVIPNCPEGLWPHTIWHWLDGKAGSARIDFYKTVLATWQALPDAPMLEGEALGLGPLIQQGDRVVLNDTARERLRELQDASGLGAVRLLDEAAQDGQTIPEGLKHTAILQWMNGATQSAKAAHLAFVVERWREAAARGLEWVDLTPEIQAQLIPMREAGLIPGKILNDAPDKPDGLTPAIISRWLSGKVKRVRVDYLEWVLGRE